MCYIQKRIRKSSVSLGRSKPQFKAILMQAILETMRTVWVDMREQRSIISLLQIWETTNQWTCSKVSIGRGLLPKRTSLEHFGHTRPQMQKSTERHCGENIAIVQTCRGVVEVLFDKAKLWASSTSQSCRTANIKEKFLSNLTYLTVFFHWRMYSPSLLKLCNIISLTWKRRSTRNICSFTIAPFKTNIIKTKEEQ